MNFTHGCRINDSDESGFAAAVALAQSSDVVIFFGGIDGTIEGEGRDRTVITLPDTQMALIQQLEKASRSPIHVVIMSGSGLDLTFPRDSNQVASLIWMGYAGQSGGTAIANVMFGEFNPSGRLPITFYPSTYIDQVSMLDMQMRPSPTNPGRTYKFYTGQPVFEFGYGLSYTTFNYTWFNDSTVSRFNIQSLMKNNDDRTKKVLLDIFRVNVTNVGPVAGDDSVLAFLVPPRVSIVDPSPPLKQLIGFERVSLNVGETAQILFPLNVQALLSTGHDGSRWLEPGVRKIMFGKNVLHYVSLEGTAIHWT